LDMHLVGLRHGRVAAAAEFDVTRLSRENGLSQRLQDQLTQRITGCKYVQWRINYAEHCESL